tara:strand:- start:1282 stop:1638 length:357 start_codon:yes stop_codon:yes gene_type:complete
MGLFTGHLRSADIFAHDDSTSIVLERDDLRGLFSQSPELHLKVLYDVIGILSLRVADANGLAETQARLVRQLGVKLQNYEAPGDDEEDDKEDEDVAVVEGKRVVTKGAWLTGKGGRGG